MATVSGTGRDPPIRTTYHLFVLRLSSSNPPEKLIFQQRYPGVTHTKAPEELDQHQKDVFSTVFWLPSEFQSPPCEFGFWCFDFFVGHGMGHESLQHMTKQATTTWCFNRSSGQRPKGVQWHVTRILSTAYAITNTLFSDEPWGFHWWGFLY